MDYKALLINPSGAPNKGTERQTMDGKKAKGGLFGSALENTHAKRGIDALALTGARTLTDVIAGNVEGYLPLALQGAPVRAGIAFALGMIAEKLDQTKPWAETVETGGYLAALDPVRTAIVPKLTFTQQYMTPVEQAPTQGQLQGRVGETYALQNRGIGGRVGERLVPANRGIGMVPWGAKIWG